MGSSELRLELMAASLFCAKGDRRSSTLARFGFQR